MRAQILATLSADATLIGLLPGGLYDAVVVGEVSRQDTPAAFDAATREIRPCGLLRVTDDAPAGPTRTSRRLQPTIYLYGPATVAGRAAVESARLRARALLHRVRVAPASGQAWELRHAGDVPSLEDPALRAALAICRYVVFVD